MSVLTELEIPADEFVMADTITAAPDMRVEIKRVVADSSCVTPYFWATNGDFEAFERALRSDPMIAAVDTLEEQPEDPATGTGKFYRVTWEKEVANLLSAVSAAKATILEAISNGGERWAVKILFPDEDALTAFHDYCIENGFSYEAERIYRPDNPQERGEYELTDDQLEALEAAFYGGYFDVPREHNLTEIADHLGISRNALSNRLRRGQRNLLTNTVIHDE